MAHQHHHGTESTGNISTAFILNALFVVVEVVGGLATNSIAILTDALHDLGDCLSLAVAWVMQKKSAKGRDNRYSYGYKRFSLLGSIFLSGALIISSVFILVEAGKRLVSPEEVKAHGMLWLAIAGIIINGAAALRVKKGSSLNERTVYLHIMEDVLGWIGVLLVSIVMLFVNAPILDPILSIGISVWVMSNVYKNLRSVFKVLLQAVPDDVQPEAVQRALRAIEGVEDIHDLHIWSLDGESHIMTVHVVSNSDQLAELKHRIMHAMATFHITHATIELEHPGEQCETGCE